MALARRDNLTVRQLAQMAGGYGGLQIVGTPIEIADTMQAWLETEACDGFNVMFPTVPAGLDDFVELVVPELQRRGIFRREYEGTTLREHLGLPRPENQFFPGQPDRPQRRPVTIRAKHRTACHCRHRSPERTVR